MPKKGTTMARSKPDALDALRKVREQREALDAREAELRAQAAGELGKLLVECGAEMLEPSKLKMLLQRTTALGIDTSLERLAAGQTVGIRPVA
jgi:hypothetical protein